MCLGAGDRYDQWPAIPDGLRGRAQEEHLTRLARDFDQRIGELRAKFGEIGDTRLTVMAALTVADQLFEAVSCLRKPEAELAAREGTQRAAADRDQGTDQTVISALNSAVERIESLTKELNRSLGESVVLGITGSRRSRALLPARGRGKQRPSSAHPSASGGPVLMAGATKRAGSRFRGGRAGS